jgi:predicted Zn-dependent protease
MSPLHASSADRYGLSRRRFLWLTAAAAAGAASGCASNPVTGETQLMMVSEQEEIQIDRQYSPMQFSSDYGPVQDASLNALFGEIASQLGGVGAGALLASYSRDNERQADALGTRYMAQAGYGPEGMVGLMNMLQNLSQSKPSSVEILFSTHPMSAERYQNAVDAVRTQYASAMGLPLHRERYMDHTAGLRAMAETIDELQNGEKALGAKKFSEEGYAQEGMNRRHDAAREYRNYLQQVQSGQYAQHAYQRLREWGYAR